jgi:hypothetical protein
MIPLSLKKTGSLQPKFFTPSLRLSFPTHRRNIVIITALDRKQFIFIVQGASLAKPIASHKQALTAEDPGAGFVRQLINFGYVHKPHYPQRCQLLPPQLVFKILSLFLDSEKELTRQIWGLAVLRTFLLRPFFFLSCCTFLCRGLHSFRTTSAQYFSLALESSFSRSKRLEG